MKNSRGGLNFLDKNDHNPVGYKDITCRLIFDVKMDPTRKTKYVSGGHLTNLHSSMTYASMVSCDSVHLDFLIGVLNDL